MKKMITKEELILVLKAVKQTGSYDPKETMPALIEDLTFESYDLVKGFLVWVNKNDKRFGYGNVVEVYFEYLENGQGKAKGGNNSLTSSKQ